VRRCQAVIQFRPIRVLRSGFLASSQFTTGRQCAITRYQESNRKESIHALQEQSNQGTTNNAPAGLECNGSRESTGSFRAGDANLEFRGVHRFLRLTSMVGGTGLGIARGPLPQLTLGARGVRGLVEYGGSWGVGGAWVIGWSWGVGLLERAPHVSGGRASPQNTIHAKSLFLNRLGCSSWRPAAQNRPRSQHIGQRNWDSP
jgi:hypothetical protein